MASAAGTSMRRWFHGTGFRSFLAWTRRTGTVIGSLVAAVLAASPEGAADLWAPLESVVRFGHDTAWIWLACAIVVGGAASWLLSSLPHPAALDATNAILDEFQEALFAKVGGDYGPSSRHAFRARILACDVCQRQRGEARWPWSGWLVPVARSGHGTRRTRVHFLCPDDTDHAQGVAGRAWASTQAVVVEDLPELGEVGESRQDGIAAYAHQTFVSENWVVTNSPRARSLMGFRVEDARSNPWGVLVVDSRLPSLNTQLAQERFNSYAPVLARLLQGA